MPRIKRKKLKFTEDSVNELMQEVYNDNHNLRAQVISLFNKWEKEVKTSEGIAVIGKQIVDLITKQAQIQDKKIEILKILKQIVFDDSKSDKENAEKRETISLEDRDKLMDIVENLNISDKEDN
jgi:hypothetical protein